MLDNNYITVSTNGLKDRNKVFLVIDPENKKAGLYDEDKDEWIIKLEYDARGFLSKHPSLEDIQYICVFQSESMFMTYSMNRVGVIDFTYQEGLHKSYSPILIEHLPPEYDYIKYVDSEVTRNLNGSWTYLYELGKNKKTHFMRLAEGHAHILNDDGIEVSKIEERKNIKRDIIELDLTGTDGKRGKVLFPVCQIGGVVIPPLYDDLWYENEPKLKHFLLVENEGKQGLLNLNYRYLSYAVFLECCYNDIRFEIVETSVKDGSRGNDPYRTRQQIFVYADGRKGRDDYSKLVWEDV